MGFRTACEDGESKLRTYRDGWTHPALDPRVTRHERPVLFHGVLPGAARADQRCSWVSRSFSSSSRPVWSQRFPTAILASAGILAMLSLVTGAILGGLRRTRQEMTRLFYLSHQGVDHP